MFREFVIDAIFLFVSSDDVGDKVETIDKGKVDQLW